MVEEAALAVVGMACRFPGARDADALWRNVLSDACAIAPMPGDRFHRERYYDPEIGAYAKSYSAIGGLLEERADLEGLPREALEAADVAHLWALDVARETFRDAGLEPDALRDRNTCVIIGHARGSMLTSDLAFGTAVEGLAAAIDRSEDLGTLTASMRANLARQAVESIRRRYPSRGGVDLYSTLASALAGRITAAFGLTGRHMVVDAACASSFAAIDAAARALYNGSADLVLSGGASYSQELSVVLFAQSRALSPDGSFPFDERANGFISSDGLGFFLLMRLQDAIESKARIRAVIRGIGGSCDGKGKALWAPRKEGQVLAMKRAYEHGHIDPATIGLIEAHATSTPIGDATEVSAVHEVFGRVIGSRKMPIGSIKGNIGHAREAAGAAGLVKAIYALENSTLPPTGNFRSASKSIPWDDVKVEVNAGSRPWNAEGVRRAGVNAFGIGGLNYHLVVEEAPPARRVFPVAADDEVTAPSLRVDLVEKVSKRPLEIAIVGIGTRLPGAPNPAALWKELLSGAATFSEVTPERWRKEIFHKRGPAQAYRTYSAHGAFLRGFAPDWRRYKVPPKLVEQNDPLQFMLLEAASDALDDAGIDASLIDRTRVAVVMGTVFGSDYALDLSLSIRAIELAEAIAEAAGRAGDRGLIDRLTAAIRTELPSINEDSSGSFSSSTLASRIAKTLDLMGPTYTIDASCGASFASLEAACEILRAGAADLAIFGGGDRAMRVQRYATYAQAGVLSHGDRVKPFSADADGFLPGEGAAVCVLERREDAERNGHPIYAVVRAIGSASDGVPARVAEPSSRGLILAMQRALGAAGVEPSKIAAIEAHGLGVPAFDAAEKAALAEVYGSKVPPLGLVKQQLGHAPGAAGATAIVKAALSLSERVWPSAEKLQLSDDAIVAVSGMSFGGASHHVVLEAAPKRRELRKAGDSEVWSDGWTPSDWVHETPGAAMVGEDDRQRAERIALFAKLGGPSAPRGLLRKHGIWARIPDRGAPRVALLFSGQGSQYQRMMFDLRRVLPAAAQVFERADRWLSANGHKTLTEAIDGPGTIGDDVFLVQASLLVADLAAFEAVLALGIEPEVVSGHSYGDYPALVAAGAWTLENALEATLLRSRGIEAAVEPGGMMSAVAPKKDVEPVIATLGAITASNINAPNQTVVSGSPAALEAAAAAFAARGIEARMLAVPRPFHSPLMRGAREVLATSLARIPMERPKLRYLSSVTATELSDPEEIRAALVEQLTKPVDFIAQIERMIDHGIDTFIECGPKGVLTGLVDQIAAGRTVDAVTMDDANKPGRWAVARVAALLASRRAPELAAAVAQPVAALTLDGTKDLLETPGFEAFWARTQPSIAALVRSLWLAEQGKTAALAPAPAPAATVKPPIVIAETPLPAASLAPKRDDVRAFLLEALCAQTGYPAELIDPNADLEADLGIDTVKQAQVLGKVRDKYQLRTDASLSLADFTTLEKIVAYVEKQLASRAETPAPNRPRVPLLDVTVRRSEPPRARVSQAPIAARPSVTINGGSNGHHAPAPQREQQKRSAPIAKVEVLHLRGTSRAIGRQHGEALRAEIRETMDRYEKFLGDRSLAAMSVPEATLRLPELFDPATLEELRGVAEGVGVPFEHLVAYNLDAALFPAFAPGCTQAIRRAATNGGRLIHAANEDSPLLVHLGAAQPRVVQIRQRTDAPDPNRRTVLFSLAGQVAGPNAASDTGLSITSCTLLDAEPPRGLPEGLPHPQLVKRLIESAKSIEDALEIVKAAKRSGRWSLLFSDAEQDRAFYLEYDGAEILCTQPIEGPFVATNHALAGPAKGVPVPDHSKNRLVRAKELLEGEAPKTPREVQAALRDRFDVARGREVPHPTMNTVRRTDNVMSLVLEPMRRRLFVTDRVPAPGSAEETEFFEIAYGAELEATHVGPNGLLRSNGTVRTSVVPNASLGDVTKIGREGSGVVRVAEVMRRSVVRVIVEDAPPALRKFAPSTVLLVGNGARVETIATRFRERGASLVEIAPDLEVASSIITARSDIETLGFVLDAPAKAPWTLEAAAWAERKKLLIEQPYALLKSFVSKHKTGCIFAVTSLGGGLGFENVVQGSPEHGAIAGLLKAIRREFSGLTVQQLDTNASSSPDQVAASLFAELDAGSPRLEVGLLRNKRVRLAMPVRAADRFDDGADHLPRSWIITGGARGITAQIALRLAETYRPVLHLLGRHLLPSEAELASLRGLDQAALEAKKQALLAGVKSPLEWASRAESFDKTIEISRTLQALEERGAKVFYHPVDVADRAALAAVLEKVRAQGAIEGLIHGAGVEVAKPFEKKSDAIVSATFGGKVDGLINLLALTEQDPITHLVAFSSVSGRFGGHGQTDYSAANEALARIVALYAQTHPKVRAAAISWPAWSEVGLAARSSAKTFLEQTGQLFMSPAEGANHFFRELWSGLREPEVVIAASLEALDLDRLLIANDQLDTFRKIDADARVAPLLGRPVIASGDRLIFERTLRAKEPFLDQHRMGTTPILPAVIALEALSELVALESDRWTIGDVSIHQPLKIADSALMHLVRRGDVLGLTSTPRRPDGAVLEVDRLHVSARRMPRRPLPQRVAQEWPGTGVPYPYMAAPDNTAGSRAIFHGPVFRAVKLVHVRSDGTAIAELEVPAVEALCPGSTPENWRIPAALLDGCLQASGVLGRLFLNVVALPAGFGRIDVSPKAVLATGQRVLLEIRQAREGDELVSELYATSNGEPLLFVERYRAAILRMT